MLIHVDPCLIPVDRSKTGSWKIDLRRWELEYSKCLYRYVPSLEGRRREGGGKPPLTKPGIRERGHGYRYIVFMAGIPAGMYMYIHIQIHVLIYIYIYIL